MTVYDGASTLAGVPLFGKAARGRLEMMMVGSVFAVVVGSWVHPLLEVAGARLVVLRLVVRIVTGERAGFGGMM